jgi:hypothetical protein
MGPSTPEIDKQIKETREHLDANLTVLEERAVSGARRAVRIAVVVGIGLVVGAGIGFAVYKLRQRQSPLARIHYAVPRSIRHLPRELSRKLKRPLPAVKLVVADSEESRGPGVWESMAQKVATTMAASAASELAARVLRRRETAPE